MVRRISEKAMRTEAKKSHSIMSFGNTRANANTAIQERKTFAGSLVLPSTRRKMQVSANSGLWIKENIKRVAKLKSPAVIEKILRETVERRNRIEKDSPAANDMLAIHNKLISICRRKLGWQEYT